MCRILFDPTPRGSGEQLLNQQFTVLEKRLGGDGNGMALLKSGKVIKGTKMDVGYLAEKAADQDEPILFHTRLASVGGKVSELCQPFAIDPMVICHNGHWVGWEWGLETLLRAGRLSFVPLHCSDSLVGARLARSFGANYLRHSVGTGVWVVAERRPELKVTAVVNTGDFAINFETGQAASERVLWEKDDTVLYLQPGSICEIYPTINLLDGEWDSKPYVAKKKGKGAT